MTAEQPNDARMSDPAWLSGIYRWPSWDVVAGTEGPVHVRRDHPDGGKAVTWETADGASGLGGRRLAGLCYVAGGALPAPGSVVVVTEGEKAADAVAAAGFAAIGTVCGASARPGPAVVALLAQYELILSPDNDGVGGKHMTRLAEDLEQAGIRCLRWIDPPAGAREHWDLADVDAEAIGTLVTTARQLPTMSPEAKAEAIESLLAIEQPLQPEASRPADAVPPAAQVHPEALSTMTRPSTVDEWDVENFLRPSVFAVIASMEGVGKSQMRDELAMRCALGRGSLFGFYPVVRQLNVLLVDEDNGPEEEWRRNEAMLAHLGAARSELTGYYRISLAGVLLDDPAWQARIRAWVSELEIGLLILDPVSMMYRAKELREELLPVANFLRALQREHPGLVVVLVHHLRKPVANQKPTDRALSDLRGALWGQVADVVALVTPLGDRRVKWALHKRIRPSELILEQTETGPFAFVAEADAGDRRQSSDDRVMACVDAGAVSIDEVVIGTGMPKRTAWNAVKRLRDAGVLRRDGVFERVDEASE